MSAPAANAFSFPVNTIAPMLGSWNSKPHHDDLCNHVSHESTTLSHSSRAFVSSSIRGPHKAFRAFGLFRATSPTLNYWNWILLSKCCIPVIGATAFCLDVLPSWCGEWPCRERQGWVGGDLAGEERQGASKRRWPGCHGHQPMREHHLGYSELNNSNCATGKSPDKPGSLDPS